jgi:hypothetical protein
MKWIARAGFCALLAAQVVVEARAQESVRGFRFPAALAGFERGEILDNEHRGKGLGVSVAYRAPGIKATVFVYDLQIRDLPEGIGSPVVQAQAVQAVRDVFAAYVDVQVLEDLAPGPQRCGDFLRAKLSYIEPRSTAKEVLHSYVYLGSKGGSFVKLRLTYPAAMAASGAASAERAFAQALCRIANG